MSTVSPLMSSAWYRVANLRPRLDARVGVARQVVRGQVWQVLSDPTTGRQVRLNPAAWAFAGRCDGKHSVDEIWHHLIETMGDAAPAQDDILQLLTRLARTAALQFDAAPNLAAMFERHDGEARRRRRAWINPLALKLSAIDPTLLLDRLAPRTRMLFRPAFLAFWALCVGFAAIACAVNLPALRAAGAALLDAPGTLLLLWLCYPPIKAVHELAHALAVRHFGGAVHATGITLLFFTPAPWVDASAASGFDRRGQRIAVSAAGIMAELAIAAVAAAVWLAVEPGRVRDCAFIVLFICTVSTLLFNGNPLLRFDAYYVLTDTLDLPNLALRSNAWWSALARRVLLGEAGVPASFIAPGERKWLFAYAPLSWAYRVVLIAALVLWVGSKSWLLGVLVTLAFGAWLVRRPLAGLAEISSAALPAATRRRALAIVAGTAALAGLLLFALPLPSSTVAQGVVWPPEHAQVRTETAGFIAALATPDATEVEAGQVLLTLHEPAHAAEAEKKLSQLAGLKAQQYVALMRDPLQATQLGEDIARVQAELARSEEQLAQLQVRGHSDGRLVLPRAADLPGSFAAKGTMLGYILEAGPANVRAVLSETEAQLVHARARGVEIRLAEAAGVALPALLEREPPAATRDLPSAALGDRAGGRFATDPADKDGRRTMEPVFLLDLAVAARLPERIGGRVWVRFDLGFEPLGMRWLREARQLMLRHFNPAGQA
ncbi:MAG: PqqD family peptide modification chaperone [Burkholderiales bacterium]|nr:PqqD family peptide modification chaperone [Burkholderiales bacterium]